MQTEKKLPQKIGLPDATSWVAAMASGEITSLELVRSHLDRLEALHPTLNAAVKVYRDRALKEAANPRPGPLSGLPISIKETFGIEGESITQGSKLASPTLVEKNATVVQRVIDAGAIVIARSNIPEFAMSPETGNVLYGRTQNPLNPDHSCGGSSGGEGALVGSASSALGIGSDIGGSIRYPASFCGVVGFKPASDAVDKTGTVPQVTGYTNTMLAIGTLTRSVRDALRLYNVIADTPLPESSGKSLEDLRLLYPVKGRIKIFDAPISEAVGNARALLLQAGMQKMSINLESGDILYKDFVQLVIHDFERAMHGALSGRDGKRINLFAEGIRQLRGKGRIYNGLFRSLFAMPIVRPSTRRAQAAVESIESSRKAYHELLGPDGILIIQTTGRLAPRHGALNKEVNKPGVIHNVQATVLCNALNLPAITLPAWKYQDSSTGLVPGVTLACAPGAEATLFEVAAFLEPLI